MTNFTRLSNVRRITAAEKLLRNRLYEAAGDSVTVRLGFQGGQEESEVWWIAEAGFWFATHRLDTRWWNGFGLDEPEPDGVLSLTVEVNSPLRGINRRIGGAFLSDEDGNVYLAHTGKVGGGRKGIGKRQFLAYFEGNTQTVDGGEYIIIGAIEADDFLDKLGEFIRTVDRFKREATGKRDEPDEPEIEDEAVAPSYWKISADTGSREWDNWHAGDYIAIGWNNLGDLSEIDGEGFEERVQTVLAEHPDWKRPRLDQVWRFATQLQEGARVVVNRGTSRVLAFGTVTGDYYFDSDASLGHRLPVRWDDTDERAVERGGWRKTLIQLKREDFEELLHAPKIDEEDDEDEDEALDAEPEERLNFDDLVARLGNQGLRFDSEALASYLLALQAKRFVILSGISGTGKTALALQVARALAPSRGASSGAVAGHRVTVMPYMLKYRRLVLPKAVSDELAALDAFDADELHVYYGEPDDEDECSLRFSTGKTAYQLLFRGGFRGWFEDTFEIGNELALSVYVNDDDSPSLVLHDAEDLGEKPGQDAATAYRSIAVRPDWTDNRGLLGYYNPITAQYQTTPFLELLLAAAAEARRAEEQGRAAEPYFVILDEMNLARVEHYFSDFLSCMESGEALHLHDDAALAEGLSETGEAIPRELTIPRNLFFTGTVNVDETTYMFSPKVLDRAFVLEFNEVDLAGYGRPREDDEDDAEVGELYLGGFDGRLGLRGRGGQPSSDGQRSDSHKPGPRDWEQLRVLADGQFTDALAVLNELLASEGRQFGYRVVNEISRFMRLAAEQAGRDEQSLWSAFDVAVLAKVLPKLHGTEQELRELLESLLGFAVAGEKADRQIETNWTLSQGELSWQHAGEAPEIWLPRTGTKLWRMLRRLRQRGFVSFIE
jgi:5-methylcytosine-specific restriction protein B